ncbi:hypothetical protein GG344DRAFT_70663 [Lentinula edodes]|nr:hypothetical protein GG344DRAFT_70663 [Lentinula edodes]
MTIDLDIKNDTDSRLLFVEREVITFIACHGWGMYFGFWVWVFLSEELRPTWFQASSVAKHVTWLLINPVTQLGPPMASNASSQSLSIPPSLGAVQHTGEQLQPRVWQLQNKGIRERSMEITEYSDYRIWVLQAMGVVGYECRRYPSRYGYMYLSVSVVNYAEGRSWEIGIAGWDGVGMQQLVLDILGDRRVLMY